MRIPRDSEQMSQGSVKYRSSGAPQFLINNNHNAMQHNKRGCHFKRRIKRIKGRSLWSTIFGRHSSIHDWPFQTPPVNSTLSVVNSYYILLPTFSAATLGKGQTMQHCAFHHNMVDLFSNKSWTALLLLVSFTITIKLRPESCPPSIARISSLG